MGNLSFLPPLAPPLRRRIPLLERHVHARLARRLDELQIPYREQYATGHGRIDFVIWNEDEDRPYLGVEVKRDLGPHTCMGEWADYLEQAAGYSRSLDVPVLLAPYVDRRAIGPVRLHTGGNYLSAVAATVIAGGRTCNVGLLALLGRDMDMYWLLRGKVVLRAYGQTIESVDDAHIRMVRSTNSHKVRG